MAVPKIVGIETEYGVALRGAPDPNPVIASSLLINGYVSVDDYTGALLANRAYADLAGRVFCHADESMAPDFFPARVELTTRDGRRYVEDVPAESIPIAVKPAETFRAPPPQPLPTITATLPADSGLELVETRFNAPALDEMPEAPRPKRVRPQRVEVASEPLEIIETRKEP